MYFKIAVLLSCLAATGCHLSEAAKKKAGIEDFSQKELEDMWWSPRTTRFSLSEQSKDSFSAINDYLVQKVESRDAKENMVAADDLLKSKSHKTCGLTKMMVSKKDKALIKALEQFTSLPRVIGDCSKDSYMILLRNNVAIGATYLAYQSRAEPLKRIDKVVFDYSKDHAKTCMPLYPAILKEKLGKLNKEHLKLVQAFTNRVIKSRISQKIPDFEWTADEINDDIIAEKIGAANIVQWLIRDLDGFTNLETACLETIEQFAVDDPNRKYLKRVLDEINGKMVIKSDQVDSLLQKYIIEPCKYYTSELEGIFLPLIFESVRFPHKFDENQLELYSAWGRYSICLGFTEQHENRIFLGWFMDSLERRDSKQS